MNVDDTIATLANWVLNPYKSHSSWNVATDPHATLRGASPTRPVHVTTIHPELVRVHIVHNGETAAFHIRSTGASTFEMSMMLNDVTTVIADGLVTSSSDAFVRRKFAEFERTNARSGKLARTLLMRLGGCAATIVARRQRRMAKRVGGDRNGVNAQRMARICLNALKHV